jgi:hypothetical protein
MHFLHTAAPRQKVVWGPKRILAAIALVAVSFGLASNANAEGRHVRKAQHVRPGTANAFVKRDNMDAEVAKRAGGLLRLGTADVIVTLETGADLADAFKRYSHNGKLDDIHGYVLDRVPVSMLSTLANQASTHRVHINRPAQKHDALSSCAVNANAVDAGHEIDTPNLCPYTGAGVTVAFIDSGITSCQHPDLKDNRVPRLRRLRQTGLHRNDDNGTARTWSASWPARASSRRRNTRASRRALRSCRSRS